MGTSAVLDGCGKFALYRIRSADRPAVASRHALIMTVHSIGDGVLSVADT